MPTLALLDGHSLAYRAFFALPSDLATPSGQVTNAVYGFTSMVIKLLGDEDPDALAVCWDTPERTFRSDRFPEYKAQREAAPDLFRTQLPLIREVADVLGFPQYEAPGFEADDVIATIARAAADAGWRVLVVTGDRDSFQLIDDRINVYYTRRGISDVVVADASYVEDRYGIRPDQYPDYAALRGDTSDNLPGVPGVGEKTASKLIAAHGDIEGIYEHLDEQTPKLRENLEASQQQVLLNRELTRLLTDIDVEVDPEAMRVVEWDQAEVRKVFDGLAFQSLWTRLQELGGAAEPSPDETLEVEVRTATEANDIAGLASLDPLAIEAVRDDDGVVGVICADEESAAFVPWSAIASLQGLLADPAVPKAFHDAKPLLREMLEADLDLRGIAFDSALAAYVIRPAWASQTLSDISGRVLHLEIDPAVEGSGTDASQGTLDFDSSGPDLEAAARRAVAVARLIPPLTEQLEARGGRALFEGVELPLIRVLARMEDAGIGVDVGYLEELGESLRDRLATLERRIYEAAGEPFNVNSTLQLREVLFDRLGLPVVKKTPKGQPSTDASVLQKLADEHPIVQQLLSYRELEKLRGTYVDGLLPLVGEDGRIHCVFNQRGAATGRISSERPNMQNIPTRSEEGRTIRRAFVAGEGRAFVVADYSQIELRILAHLSGDEGLVRAFMEGEDIHTATAARVFAAGGEVDHDMRRRAKVINFGLLYGMEAYGLAQRLEISREEAQEQMDAYFAQFPGVRDFMGGIVEDARNAGYTETILGRRRYLPELTSGNFRERQAGERMALNAPIQGAAADIIKKAMIELDGELEAAGDGTMLLLQVHDELVLETDVDRADETAERVRAVMEATVSLDVPLQVDVGIGATLADAKG